MTEEEWLACEDPERMLKLLSGKTSDRKLRLFACACMYRFWNRLADDRCRRAVEVSERLADGLADEEEIATVCKAVNSAWQEVRQTFGSSEEIVVSAAGNVLSSLALVCFGAANRVAWCMEDKKDAEQANQASLFRDIFPFHTATIHPSWLTSTVVSLAQQMSDTREFTAMPILADALMDAGCDNPQILEHCRGQGPHVRGCFVVDACLRKE